MIRDTGEAHGVKSQSVHTSVLLHESLQLLDIKSDDIVLDLTVGMGGHSQAFLQCLGPQGRLYGIDQDQNALALAKEVLCDPRVHLIHGNFSDLAQICDLHQIHPTVIFADLGVSSLQFDTFSRGFSFRGEGPLDMRMDVNGAYTAADFLAQASEEEMKQVFSEYGEIPYYFCKQFSHKIIEKRKEKHLSTTSELAYLLEKIKTDPKTKKKLLTQAFQAIRIRVNGELEALERMLLSSFGILSSGGRLGCISFHSLEDRRVKDFMKYWAMLCFCPKQQVICNCHTLHPKRFALKKPFPVMPSAIEIQNNPRARSARLRVATIQISI